MLSLITFDRLARMNKAKHNETKVKTPNGLSLEHVFDLGTRFWMNSGRFSLGKLVFPRLVSDVSKAIPILPRWDACPLQIISI